MSNGFRPEFEEALRFLGQVIKKLVAKGFPPPILVGGGAVEFYTAGKLFSGDFDLTTPYQEALEKELLAFGFEKPVGAGVSTKGWVHPDLLIGIEVVGRTPFEGLMDQERITLVDVGGSEVLIVPVEDLIADRLGQYNAPPRNVPEMLEQAIYLYNLASGVDKAYLNKRIREETLNDYGLEFLEEQADAHNDTE